MSAASNPKAVEPWGTTPDQWQHLDLFLGLSEDLLPAVSNPYAVISEKSSISELGKVPSRYNHTGQVAGFPAWTKHRATPYQIDQWSRQPDYGICIITREVRALDVDVTDPVLANKVQAFIADHLGYQLPKRYRANSSKFLHPFRMVSDNRKYGKWVVNLRTPEEEAAGKKDIIEILMTGYQFVAVGTHPSGVKIEWEGGLPSEIPELTTGEFEALCTRLQNTFGKRPLNKRGAKAERVLGKDMDIKDPAADFLRDKSMVLSEGRGGLLVQCPWENAHTMGNTGNGSTLYYPAGSNGYPGGGFKCQHSHCEKRTVIDFYAAVGYELSVEESCAGLSDEPTVGERRKRQQVQNRVIGVDEFFSPMPDLLTTASMLERFVFLSDGSWVFDTLHPKHTRRLTDFKNVTAASTTEVQTGNHDRDGTPKTKRIQNTSIWLPHKERKTAFSTTFQAGAKLYIADPKNRQCVNTWSGYNRHVDGSKGDPSLVIEHIQWLFKERADDFLDWLAHIEQRPGELPHTGWLHIALSTGIGRNAMSGVLARVFAGYSALSVNLESVLESGFNEELSCKVLAVVDEIRVGGREQWAHAERFKQLITEPQRMVNVKYGPKSLEFNACRWLIFSNYRSALPLTDTDRRVEVVISSEKPQPPDYYKRLYAAIDAPFIIAAFAKFLADRDIRNFNPGRQALPTDDKRQVIEFNRSETQTNLIEFTASYPCELVTSKRLQGAAGFSGFGSDGPKFTYAVQDAGWEKVGRVSVNGVQMPVYARRERVAYWLANKLNARTGLPKQDGGLVDWIDPNNKLCP